MSEIYRQNTIRIAHITFTSGEKMSCLLRNETKKTWDIQIVRVLGDSLFDYTSGLIKTVKKTKIKQIEWKH